ncbi:LysR family transcriptional regulator [Roseovarius pacificus]|uniref:LysR family transcriptional regulator n=1 Tax=Roseovarius pacificus TaxID=337701 RepID=UPI002A18A68C|nr:LysR family transcriptional regulator [Roseovarius pacificus]
MLRCFRAVAEQGSLADAAEILGRTPSAVSMMLRQFEDHVGAPLFESTRKSRLTPLGELIHAEARRELVHFDRTVAAITGMARAELGHVRLAVTPSVAQVIMPPILRDYMARHPGVNVDLRDGDSATIQRDLTAERADIALATLGPIPGFTRHLILTDRFGVVCRADHPLARDWSDLGWSDLADVDFIANGLCDHIRDESFTPIRNGARLNVANTASLLSLVRAGVGVTLLPELAVQPGQDDLCFLPLIDSSARREIWMLTPPDEMMTPAARALVSAIRSTDLRDPQS